VGSNPIGHPKTPKKSGFYYLRMNWLLIIPIIGAITGWMIGWIIVQGFFYPRTPRKFLGITFQGIVYKKQQGFAKKTGELAANLFSTIDIGKQIGNPANTREVMPVIEEHIDHFLRNKLTKEMPVLSMFIGDKTIDSLKKTFLKEIEEMLPKVLGQFTESLKKNFDPGQLVTNKISAISPEDLKKMLSKNLAAEFRLIKLAGALIGLVAGIIQVLVSFLIVSAS
jgi:uncharacterized membrane protein YheB (UPF0754 family)